MVEIHIQIQTNGVCCDTDCPFYKDVHTTRCLLFKEELYTANAVGETFRCDDCLWVTQRTC